MKSDFKQTLKNAYFKDFFIRIKNEIEDSDDQPQEVLTKSGITLLYPKLKPLIEYISQNGAPLGITLNDLDFNLIKN